MTGRECPRGIAGRNRAVHQHAGGAIARHHARIAWVAEVRDAIEVEDRTHGFAPCLAAPDVKVPVHIKVLVAADARDRLRLTANVAGDFVERCLRVEYRE